jgi:hypothetical protein
MPSIPARIGLSDACSFKLSFIADDAKLRRENKNGAAEEAGCEKPFKR